MENIERIERYVGDLLTVSGFHAEGEERRLWTLLHHLYSAVAMFELATPDEKITIAETQKKLRYFFKANCNLKERRRNKKAKENNPPAPPLKEKENKKEKAEKPPAPVKRTCEDDFEERKDTFWKECLTCANGYDEKEVKKFFLYWSEEMRGTGKMLFETRRAWNTKNRMALWMNNSFAASDTAAAIRLRKTKEKQAAATTEAVQQKRAAEERQKQQQKLEQQAAESRRDATTMEEQVARNPNGILARFARERKAREKL